MTGIGIAGCESGCGCGNVPGVPPTCETEECCTPTSLGLWFQRTEQASNCYLCDTCDTGAFQVILDEVAGVDEADFAFLDETCTASSAACAYDISDLDFSIYDMDCVYKYYRGEYTDACFACELLDPVPEICEGAPQWAASSQKVIVYALFGKFEDAGLLDCRIRIHYINLYYYGTGATAIEACENLTLQQWAVTVVFGEDYADTDTCCGTFWDLSGVQAGFQCYCTDQVPPDTFCTLVAAISTPGHPEYTQLEGIC